MTCEELWYRMYTDEGSPPACRRLNRLPPEQQWAAVPELAIAILEGGAGWRPTFRRWKNLVEYWYYFPNCWNVPGDTGWWLMPQRIERWARELTRAAMDHAMRGKGWCENDDAASVIRIWQRSGHWQRKVRGRTLRQDWPELTARQPGWYGLWYQRTLARADRKASAA